MNDRAPSAVGFAPRRSPCLPIMLLILLTMLGVTPAFAEDPPGDGADKDWSVTLDAAFNGKYVWRGINVVDDPVFQPSLAASYKGWTASIWGNLELTGVNGFGGDFTELDFGLDYSWSYGMLDFSTGAIYYRFPQTGAPSTVEVYGAVGADVFLSPTLTVYYDIDEADGAYVTLSAGHTFEDVWELSETVTASADLSASLGYGTSNYNAFYFGADQNALVDLTLSAGLPIALGERWTVTPSLNYASLLDGDLRRAVSDPDNFWVGLSLSCSF